VDPHGLGDDSEDPGRAARGHRSEFEPHPDAQLAALAIEYGVPVVSNDSDFARFADCTWLNPLAG
jgi:hypothetical protein